MGSRSKDRAAKAIAAMSDMGFARTKTKLVLKQLLRTCENNWKHIEAENYRLLVEALLESEEPEVENPKEKKNSDESSRSKRKEAPPLEEHEPYTTRQRGRKEEGQLLTSVLSAGMSSSSSLRENLVVQRNPRGRVGPSVKMESLSSDTSLRQGSDWSLAIYPDGLEERVAAVAEQKASVGDVKTAPSLGPTPRGAAPTDKDVQVIGAPGLSEVPLAYILPHPSWTAIREGPPSNYPALCERIFPSVKTSTSELNSSSRAQVINAKSGEHSFPVVRKENSKDDKLANIAKSSTDGIEVVSSATGEAKVSLSYNVDGYPNFNMPSLESVMKKVEDKCLRSYKIFDPSFSLLNIMKELCNTFLEMGTESVESKQEDLVRITPLLDPLKLPSIASSSSGLRLPQGLEPMAMDGLKYTAQLNLVDKGSSDIGNATKEMNVHVPEPSRCSVLVHQHEPALGDVRPLHDIHDITKGEERVRISVVSEVNKELYPPHFSYIPHNIVYQNAHLPFSLARISDENCCSDCFGDCLSARIPCACARETNGVYAYTLDGLLKKEFLDDCISMKHEPKKHHLLYCKDCPLERAKNEVNPDPCKGHLVRKFIKECWSKCGCNKQCGNRVTQRGIICNLQVFFTPEGKGWGLRALDDLPEGTFICEYVGEVLTNMELYDRMIESTGNAKHTYPVLLDADWGSEGVLRDEEALCLDATFYGNVARFINHRCGDGNLIEVPVEVETPDHHYYHLAFFTARKVEAFEELTWDYGIDFDDENHPVKAFRCCCGSKFCRDRTYQNRRKSGAFVSR